MIEYQKDFRGWAKVAEKIEKRERLRKVKPGAVYWCNFGVNVGRLKTEKEANSLDRRWFFVARKKGKFLLPLLQVEIK